MRQSLFLLTCLMWTSVSAQGIIPGIVTYQNSGDQPVVGALVKVGQSNQTETDGNGTFLLTIPGKQPGYEVILKVENPGYEIVNKKELYATLKADASRRFKLYMCLEGEWERNAIAYYEINEKVITAKYQKQVEQAKKDLTFSGKVLSDSLARLHEQFQIALNQADDLSRRFATANLDDASELYKRAFAFFIEGKIDRAIEVLEDDLMDEQMRTAKKEEEEGKILIKQGQKKDSVVQKATGDLAQNYLLKAELAMKQFPVNWDSVFYAYEQVIRIDPETATHRRAFAQVLSARGYHRRARQQYKKLLELTGDPLVKAQIHQQIAQTYHEQGEVRKAIVSIDSTLRLRVVAGSALLTQVDAGIASTIDGWIAAGALTNEEKEPLQSEWVRIAEACHDSRFADVKVYIAAQYDRLSRYRFFTRDVVGAEIAARKGLELAPEQKKIQIQLAQALLFQGEIKESRAICKQFRKQAYDETRSWSEVFLDNLDKLEAKGITHPDAMKIRKLLTN